MKSLLKVTLAIAFLSGVIGSSLTTEAYPPFLRQAAKYGAKNCLYCHKEPQGGEGWNKRGEWIIAEKEKRKAEAIDVKWLEEYKEEATEETPKEGEKEKKPEKPEKPSSQR